MIVGDNYAHKIFDPLNDELINIDKTNTWKTELEDVELSEFVEVFNVNLVAPFLLNTQLKKLMEKNNP